MEVFRISEEQFSHKIEASGKASRWNEDNQYVLYTGSSRALSTLEKIVHFNSIQPAQIYSVMVISIADNDDLITRVLAKDMPPNWRSDTSYSLLQDIGSKWYASNQSLILQVPSAIITKEHNYLINTQHKDFKKNIKLIRREEYFWDERLV